MNKTGSPLLSVLILSLFSLSVLQGVRLLRDQSNVLGETTGTGLTYPNPLRKCADLRGNCNSNCQPTDKPYNGTDCGTKVCCVPFPKTTVTPTKPTLAVPCAEIEKIQKLYCNKIGTTRP
jgi:hypothetical protein